MYIQYTNIDINHFKYMNIKHQSFDLFSICLQRKKSECAFYGSQHAEGGWVKSSNEKYKMIWNEGQNVVGSVCVCVTTIQHKPFPPFSALNIHYLHGMIAPFEKEITSVPFRL